MQVFRFSVFSSARLRGTTIPNQWRNLVRDGEVGEVGRRESHEVQTRFGAFGWGQCHKSHWSHRSVLRKGSAATSSILFDKVRFGKALKAQNLFGSVFASTLSLRRHHVGGHYIMREYEGLWCLVSLDWRYQPHVQCLTQRLACLVSCTKFWNVYELILWTFTVCQIFQTDPNRSSHSPFLALHSFHMLSYIMIQRPWIRLSEDSDVLDSRLMAP